MSPPLESAHRSQAPDQAFRTADGWLTIGANTPNTWAGLCRTLAMTAELADPGYADATRRHARRASCWTPTIRGAAGPPLGADTRAVLTRAGVPADVVDAVSPPSSAEMAIVAETDGDRS